MTKANPSLGEEAKQSLQPEVYVTRSRWAPLPPLPLLTTSAPCTHRCLQGTDTKDKVFRS